MRFNYRKFSKGNRVLLTISLQRTTQFKCRHVSTKRYTSIYNEEREGEKNSVNSFPSIWLPSKRFLYSRSFIFFFRLRRVDVGSTWKRTVTNKIQLNFFFLFPQSHKLTLLYAGDLKFSKWDRLIVEHCGVWEKKKSFRFFSFICWILFLEHKSFTILFFFTFCVYVLFIGCQWKAVVIMFIYSCQNEGFEGKLVEKQSFTHCLREIQWI